MGLLSGKYASADQLAEDDIRRKNPDWLLYFDNGKPVERFVNVMKSIHEILTSEGRSTVQGALAWIWATSPNNIPIPGFRNVAQVQHNAAAMSFGPLRSRQLEELAELFEEM